MNANPSNSFLECQVLIRYQSLQCFFLAMSRRTKFSPAEDKDLLALVEAHKHQYPPGRRKLWLFTEANRVTLHSWQAMKSRWQLLTQGPKEKRAKTKTKTKDAYSPRPPTQRRLAYFPLPRTETTTRPTGTATATATGTGTATATATVTSTQPTLTSTLQGQGRRHFTDAATETDDTNLTDLTDSTE